jgi:hypothetical protein
MKSAEGKPPPFMAQKGSSHMLTIVTADTETLIEAFFGPRQHDAQMQAWRWHQTMLDISPNYFNEISVRQAAKRAAGIGPEGRCRRRSHTSCQHSCR